METVRINRITDINTNDEFFFNRKVSICRYRVIRKNFMRIQFVSVNNCTIHFLNFDNHGILISNDIIYKILPAREE